MMISDGLGPASVSFARTYYQYENDHPYDFQMPLDTIHVGQSRTRSSSSLVTDSAAGATAFSCGLKTYNGAIGGITIFITTPKDIVFIYFFYSGS
jgi:alkaline phosphatase